MLLLSCLGCCNFVVSIIPLLVVAVSVSIKFIVIITIIIIIIVSLRKKISLLTYLFLAIYI